MVAMASLADIGFGQTLSSKNWQQMEVPTSSFLRAKLKFTLLPASKNISGLGRTGVG